MESYCDFKEEWRRTEPDFVVYRPKAFARPDYENQHLIVNRTPIGDLLAIWTSATRENYVDQRVVCARSTDQGKTWSEPQVVDGPENDDDHIASWAAPVVSRVGRIYLFYNKYTGIQDRSPGNTGVMRCRYSDDDGHTWVMGCDIPMRRTEIDHPDPRVPCSWIMWQNPIRDPQERVVVGFTRRASHMYQPTGIPDWETQWWWFMSQCEIVRFDNIDGGPHPKDLKLTFLPDDPTVLRVAHPKQPLVSYAQEPAIVFLPDRRLFLVMRTWAGRIYYSVSDDDGHTWRRPEPLRHWDGGDEMLQPKSGSPLYRMQDGRFLLFYHNNDGTAHGGTGPGDYLRNRWPLFLALGEYRAEAYQPIWFSRPKAFATTDGIGKPSIDEVGRTALNEVGDYTSFTEDEAGRILWYPDRKHFLLGKYITNEFLADMHIPE
jgi:hypothetical protein